MAGFEDVILRALEKQRPETAELREQIYNSARATLANMLNKSGKLAPDQVIEQQQKLEAAIAKIESAYRSVMQQATAEGTSPSVAIAESDALTSLDFEASMIKPFWRRPFSMLLLGTIVLAAFGISAWWVYDQELTKPAELRDNSVPNPPKILADESSAPADLNKDADEWLAIFETGDPVGLITPPASTAVLNEDASGKFVRLKSASGDLQRSFKFIVEPGIIETVTGKTAIFEIVAKSSNQSGQTFIVTCQFGEYGDCGSNRFTTEQSPKNYSIKRVFNGPTASTSEKAKTISLIVDISGQGSPLDVYSLRVKILK